MRRVAWVLGLGLAAAGCSLLLDTSKTGLPCDADGKCLPGYVCDAATGTCQPAKTGPCTPACGPGEKCAQQRCVPSCDADPSVEPSGKWPCAAGQFCSNGQCLSQQDTGQLGDLCDPSHDPNNPDADCTGDPQAFCLRPYGGGSSMCTRLCATDADCQVPGVTGGGDAPKCIAYPDGNGATVSICAPATFLPCHQESDCNAAGLSCGVYVVDKQSPMDSLLACRERLSGGKSIGETCSPAEPCENGLCEQTDARPDWECLTPCTSVADCEKTMAGPPQPSCNPIALADPASQTTPVLRTQLCMPGEIEVGQTCAPATSSCAADAPDCVPNSTATGNVCAPLCAAGAPPCPPSTSCQGKHCE